MSTYEINDQLRRQVEETINYLSYSLKQDVEVTGSIGFQMQSSSGEDMSFIISIEDTEEGKIATGTFGDPTPSDVLVIIPPEEFINIYRGEQSISAITSLVLRGKISVRNYDLNGVSRFMNSFEFSSQKWQDFYSYQEENKKRDEKILRFTRILKNFQKDPIVVLKRPLFNTTLFEKLYSGSKEIIPLPLLPTIKSDKMTSIIAQSATPIVDKPNPPEDTILDKTCIEAINTQPQTLIKNGIFKSEGYLPSVAYPTPHFIQDMIHSFDQAYPDVTDSNEPNMFTEDSTVNMWEGIPVPKTIQRIESYIKNMILGKN